MDKIEPAVIFGPWLPRRRQGAIRMIAPEELAKWILFENDDLIVLNKPADVVCHPSKDGPWSSLVGAVREYTVRATVHLIFRLDRETSGVVVFAKNPVCGRKLQMATQERKYAKTYLAIMAGILETDTTVNQPLGDDRESAVSVKSSVVAPGEGQPAVTRFLPLASGSGYTLTRVTTETGRKHQIRAHAEWLGFPLVGDKIYGGDAHRFLEFVETGWTPALAAKLILPRQALHCESIDLRAAGEPCVFRAPLTEDLREFCTTRMRLSEDELNRVLGSGGL